MCLLGFIREDTMITYEEARIASVNNPDGFGFAIHTGKSIATDRDMDFNKLWERFEKLRLTEPGPAIFHWRIGTHGHISLDNCHPFFVGGNRDSVIAHNGILPITMPHKSEYSDTRIFAETILPHLGGVTALDDDVFVEKLEEWIGWSKLAILTTNPDNKYPAYIMNELQGHWNKADTVWWSNSSYEFKRYLPAAPHYNLGSYNTPYSVHAGEPFIYEDEDEIEYGFENYKDFYQLEDSPNNIVDYVQEELYLNQNDFDKVHSFTQFIDENRAIVTCWSCDETVYTDPLDPSPTHCGGCKACLSCGSASLCKCWEYYEYGQSFTDKTPDWALV